MSGLYAPMLARLKNMDEKQLLELFHDLEDLEVVERIADCANHYVENFEQQVDNIVHGKTEYEDWKEQDDAQRYRDIKSTQDSMK